MEGRTVAAEIQQLLDGRVADEMDAHDALARLPDARVNRRALIQQYLQQEPTALASLLSAHLPLFVHVTVAAYQAHNTPVPSAQQLADVWNAQTEQVRHGWAALLKR